MKRSCQSLLLIFLKSLTFPTILKVPWCAKPSKRTDVRCVEVLNRGNNLPDVFAPGDFSNAVYDESISKLISRCRDFAEDYPASVIQYKKAIDWKSFGQEEGMVLFLRHMEPPKFLSLHFILHSTGSVFISSCPKLCC